MLTALFSIRFVSVLATIAALFGALLMFLTCSAETIGAYQIFLGFKQSHLVGGPQVETFVKL